MCCCCLLYLSFPSVCILTSITTFRSIACFGNRLVRLAPESKNPATPTSSQSFSYYIVAIVDLFVCFVLFTLALKSTWVYTWRSRYTQSQHTVHYKRLGSWLRGWMCSYWAAQIVVKQYKGEAANDSLSLLMPAWLSFTSSYFDRVPCL